MGIKYDRGLKYDGPVISKRIIAGETIQESMDRIPFLKRFKTKETFFSSFLVNEYMGYKYVRRYADCTIESVDGILEEAEMRGDI